MKERETGNENGAMMVSASPELMMRQSNDVAGVCRNIVETTAVRVARSNRKHVCVEGWQAIATAHGCVAGAEEPRKEENGFLAQGYVRRISDGLILSTGYGFVGNDEPTWASRPEYARRAMAQTRGISRACRSAFAHVVVLMKAGLDPCPAEEIPAGGFNDAAPPRSTAQAGQAAQAAVNGGPDWRKVEVHFGKNKGTPLGALRSDSLDWYQQKWTPRPNPGDGSMDHGTGSCATRWMPRCTRPRSRSGWSVTWPGN